MCPPVGHFGSWAPAYPLCPSIGKARITIAGSFGIKYFLLFYRVSAAEQWIHVSGSNMAASQKVEGPVLTAVGGLKLVPQAELPLVLQLQSDDGLTQGAPVLADHAESGACGHEQDFKEIVPECKSPVINPYTLACCLCYLPRLVIYLLIYLHPHCEGDPSSHQQKHVG